MAKGQKKSSREAKRPKAAKKPDTPPHPNSRHRPGHPRLRAAASDDSPFWIFRMKFRPLHDRIVLRRITAEEKSRGGIIIPDTVKEKPMEGEIVAAGPGARNEQGVIVALEVKAGDRVLFGKWSGTEVKIDGEELLIMKESDLLGIIDAAA
jgi:chaperonin GroES